MVQWSAEPPWAVTSAAAHGGAASFTDSPGTNYANDADLAFAMASNMDLQGAVRPRLSFWHRYALENGFDFGQVEISLDGGANWEPTPLASFTGGSDWCREEVDLTGFAGEPTVRIRFRLTSDSTVTQDGWYLDDILVDEGPAAVVLDPITIRTANTLALSWSASGDLDFASYRIVRGMTAGFEWRSAYTVTTISAVGTLSYTDIALSPKSAYRFRVVVTDTQGFETPSNEVSGTTLAGMDFPFLDNGESGTATWIADPPWGLSAEAARSGANAWSDSPGENYADNLSGTSLTLSAPLNLSAATKPILSFWHTFAFPGNDHGLVEVSTNGGLNWTQLKDYTNGTLADWTHIQVDLSAYKVLSVLVRFRVTTDGATVGDGWHVDDIAVAEQPTVVTAPVLSNIASHTIDLTWLANAEPNFSAYAIHYANTTGVSLTSPLATSIPNQATTTFHHTGLALNTPYYYRIYAVNNYGVYSPDSATEGYAWTLNNPLPFSDGFEGALDNWNLTGSWSKNTTDTPHGGSACLQDSPGSYQNSSDTYAMTAVDLSSPLLVRPVLTFWDRFAFQQDADWGVVEVSTDGSGWTRRYCVTGSRAGWAQQQIDLSEWKGQPNLRIRFRLLTDGAITADGWSIDDVSVLDLSLPVYTLPFTEDFESGASRWLIPRWSVVSSSPHGGSGSLQSSVDGRLYPGTTVPFHLAGALNLSGSTSPQLTFWVRGHMFSYTQMQVFVSTDNGLSWPNLMTLSHDWSHDGDWVRQQVDLTPYKTQAALRLRFQVNDYWGAGGDEDLFLDDIAIEESPAAVTLGPADPVTTTTAQLTWTKYAPADFKEYLVYRGTSPGITNANGALIRTAADPNATQWLDTNLQLRRTYYYRVYVKNQHDTVTGSNEVSATTLGVTMGTVEDFESGSGSWTLSGGWTRMAGVGRSGGYALVDSAGDYPNSSDTLPLTATLGVDLTTAVWPVLTFWDHGAFQLNADWGVVEISTNQGAGWSTRRYAVTGIRNTWRENKIDLSEWKGNGSVWIRFRTTTDGGVPADGWYLDDVVVAENAHGPLGYPYVNGFESGMGDLLSSQWTQSGENPREGATLLVSNSGQRLYPSAEEFVYLAGALDLRAMTAPSLVYWVRGHMYCCTQFTAQVSTNGGLTWANVGPFLQNDWAQENTWIRHQVDLTPYIAQAALRIRFKLNDYWGAGGDANLYLDGLRIGEPAPSAPTPTAPANGSTVPVFRPTLTVANAYDVQWDNLTYRFEIYSDEAMTQLVAQVPSVAETAATTSWAVDTDLLNNHQYWWRCRASDGTNIGPWSATATFYVVQVNNPPTVPQIVSPSNGTSLWGTDAPLIWYPSTDPNVGDSVTYDLQIDNDPAFGSPEVNETGIDESHGIVPQPESTTITVTLGALGGYGNLQNFTVYYWRLRAVDNRGAASSWTSESRYFLFGNDTQAPAVSWAAPTDGATLTASPVTFSGTASDDFAGLDYIQWSVDGGASWQLAAGAGSWNFSYAPTQNGDLEVLVRAADKAGNLSTPLSRNYAVALPDIPLNLRAWPDNSAVLLTWQAPALAGASGYHVYRSITSRSGYTKVTVTPVTEFTFTDTGLTNGTPYYYAARAVYAGEEKGYSDEAWAVPMASGRPPFVGDLMVSRSGDDLVLTWNPLTVDTGGGAYACPDYEVYTGNALTFVPDILGNANRLAIVGTEATYTAIGAAVDGQTYYIHVTAADALGNEGLWTQWRREENGQEASASPDWTAIPDPAASGGGYLTSATMDGAVTLTFSGTAVSLSALMGPDQGIAAVTIDGIPFGMLDLYSAGVQWRGWVFHADGLSDGPHTLVYEVVGTKNGASSGVDVNLDGYLFGRR